MPGVLSLEEQNAAEREESRPRINVLGAGFFFNLYIFILITAGTESSFYAKQTRLCKTS
ncbi:hypothetical protein [Heyndrickxia acidicola]|uniref:Photosystem II protein L n=1 Tax=Heyndrickxia acidicola TaxID=209389 RepID=A0ABU6MLY4_9BACI|nr:hypothetical protein [Heyndrickxia acidicola]MED1205699.1 hypothetical protein [Heyndrickxia acidicola]